MTKMGMEMTKSVLTRTRLSMNLPLRMPARTPAVMPMSVSQARAMRASLPVIW